MPEAAPVGLQGRPRGTFRLDSCQGCVFLFIRANSSFSFLPQGEILLGRALAEKPKLTLNLFSFCLACRPIVLFKVSHLRYSRKTHPHSPPSPQTTCPQQTNKQNILVYAFFYTNHGLYELPLGELICCQYLATE